MSLKSRRELLHAVLVRYRSASKISKSQILDEFVESTGYDRKYAIVLLGKADVVTVVRLDRAVRRKRRRKYGTDIEQPFMSLWNLSGYLCPKRLIPFLADLIDALERFDEIHLFPHVKIKLLTMSVSTAERLLQRVRRQTEHGISTTTPGTLLRHTIPIRTYEDWAEDTPGFMEIDLVAHCGGTAAGDYCYTLTMTDISTSWTENVAVTNRSQIAVQEAIEVGRRLLPFPLLGIDSDNGGEFINYHLKRYCDEKKIVFTRCRPYKKNDQAHVEQKNGAVVRPLVGYARYEGAEAVAHLNRLYASNRLSLNFFEPSMKLVGKTRVGAHVKKSYDVAKTPWQRLQDAAILSETALERMKQRYLKLNPAQVRRKTRELEAGLPRFATGHIPLIRDSEPFQIETERSNARLGLTAAEGNGYATEA